MTVKKDFMALQREMIENKLIDENEIDEYNGKNVLLNFKKTGIQIRSEFNGNIVFPRAGNATIDEGTWICTLEKDRGMYLAAPVKKLDSSFFMELKRTQKDEIIDALWTGHRDALEPYFKELYSQQMNEMIGYAVKETTDRLNKEIEDLKTINKELEEQIETERAVRSSEPVKEEMKMEGFVQLESAVVSGIAVKRISPEIIESPFFTHAKYFVHISYDLKTMVIKPHDYGTVICFKNKLFLTGLDRICTFKGECQLTSRYDQEKGLIIMLR